MKLEQERNLWARESERPFLRRVADWMERVRSEHRWILTDFLTPREITLLDNYAQSHLVVRSFGGTPFAERTRALIMPEDWFPDESDFEIRTLQVQATPPLTLTHGSILGSVLGTGLDRKKIGDIFLSGNHAYIMMSLDVVKFLQGEWHHVGRNRITLEVVEGVHDVPEPVYEETMVSLASLRLDALIGQSCHLSRGKAQETIAKGNVSLNFLAHDKVDETVEVGDVVSVRGFGRIKVLEVIGKSKSDRIRLRVGIIRSRN